MIDAALADLRDAWRALCRKPGFFAAAAATLALGIGANVVVFSVINAVLLRPMPFGDRSDRVVSLHATHRLLPRDFSFGDTEISYSDLLDFRAARSFEGLGGYLTRNFTLTGDETSAERVRGGSVTPDLFPLLGVQPQLGRHFAADEGAAPGLESVVMLSDRLWRRRYGADPGIVGRTIVVNDRSRTVVGVLPPGFRFPEWDELYMPLRWDEAPRSARNVNGVAVLKRGIALAEARAEVDAIAERLATTYPETNRGFGVAMLPFRDTQLNPGRRETAGVLMAAVGLVLLIVCANLANLMLVRGAARQREIAVRAAMGASRIRLLSGVLTEGALLAGIGAALGLIGSVWALDYLLALWPQDLPYWMRFDIDWRIAVFVVVTTAFTAIAIGIMPAIRAARPNLMTDLAASTRGLSLGRAGQRLQGALSIAQIALCLALLVGANLMIRTFLQLQRADLGFDTSSLATARGYLAGDAYDDVQTRAAFFQQLTQTLGQLPGAVAAAVTTAVPGGEGGTPVRAVVDGRTGDGDEVGAQTIAVSAGLFDVLGLAPIEGRRFTDGEVLDPEADVTIANRSLAERLWPGESAIDRRIGIRGAEQITWFRIVGVVPDVHYEEVGSATEQSRLNLYVPYARDGSRAPAMIVRSDGDPRSLLVPLQEASRRLSAAFPVFGVMTMSEMRRMSNWQERVFGMMMGAFALTAMLLACLGVYALVAYSTSRRAREIGVRLALGARPKDVTGMFVRESVVVAFLGTVIGIPLGLGVAQALSGTLYGVTADAWLFVTVVTPLVLVLLLATWLPARRAARGEPTVALRDE